MNTTRTRNHKTPVLQVNNRGRVLAEYSSIHEATKATKLGYNTITRALKGMPTSTGLNFRKVHPYAKPRKAISISQLNQKGKVVASYPSIYQAAQSTGIPYANIWAAVRKYYGSNVSFGYIWTKQ